MTTKKVKSSDILGDNYYIYELTSSNYTPNLNSSITITCTVKNIYGDIITNKSVQLYQNDVAVGNAKTTNNNGVVTWTITCSTAGVQKFSVKDNIIEIFVDTTSKTGHNHTISNITNLESTLNGKANSSHTHTASQITDLINVIYPVGSIYMSVNDTSPATLFGVGTWTKIEGAFLLASGRVSIDTETYIDFENGDTGGEAIHTLSVDEMPSHTHTQNEHNHTQNSHSHRLNNSAIIYNGSASGQLPNGTSKKYTTNSGNDVGTDGKTATNNPATATNQNTGGGQPHNNMPPYLTVNVWKRTA